MRKMPSQRYILKNALTSEGSSNTASKQRWEQRPQRQMAQSLAHGGLVLGCNTSPNPSRKAREIHLPTTEPGNHQQQESGEPQTRGNQTMLCCKGVLGLKRILQTHWNKCMGRGVASQGQYQGLKKHETVQERKVWPPALGNSSAHH